MLVSLISSADLANVQTGLELIYISHLWPRLALTGPVNPSVWQPLMETDGRPAKLPKIKTPGPWYVLWVMWGISFGNCGAHPHCIRPVQTPGQQPTLHTRYEDVKMEKSSFIFEPDLAKFIIVISSSASNLAGRILIFPFSSPDSGRNARQLTGCWCLSFSHFSCCAEHAGGAQWNSVTHETTDLTQCHHCNQHDNSVLGFLSWQEW